jgi:SAM-dependent methyltransferase
MYHGAELIKDMVPADHSRQVSSKYYTDLLFRNNNIKNVADLGCGTGDSVDYFRKINPDINWIGIDLELSPEVANRTRKEFNFCAYDGINIPLREGTVDLLYCRQVFEHVERPFELIMEINRVIRPGGFFVGSTSQLEPFHSLSVCNFTPYGFSLLLRDTDLKLLELRPGVDVVTVLLHRLTGAIPVVDRYLVSPFFEKESIFNYFIGLLAKIIGKSHQDINLIKLLFCGQYRFLVKKE